MMNDKNIKAVIPSETRRASRGISSIAPRCIMEEAGKVGTSEVWSAE